MVNFLLEKGVTDIFGIPGVVILDFLYAVNKKQPFITPHLSYHEQGASFAACGYAQVSGELGVAYSTRGPGFTNMITAIADAYYDSIPTMFITAHSNKSIYSDMRVMDNQEIDVTQFVKHITKRATRVDKIEDFQKELMLSYSLAMGERKGPVVLDIWSGLFSQEIDDTISISKEEDAKDSDSTEAAVKRIEKEMCLSKRPVILIGNGIRNDESIRIVKEIVEKYQIPVISSRTSQDIMPDSDYYFGFIGSRATRYSNFIMSKADLIISLGNRMAVSAKSRSFWPILENTKVIRIEIDSCEFERKIPNSANYSINVNHLLSRLESAELTYERPDEWLEVCRILKRKLDCWDCNPTIQKLRDIIGAIHEDTTLVCDVGNHSFWVTLAYAYQGVKNRILYSGSFGTLGSALPKAIGAYYAKRKPVICFAGDQGIQLNIQELQYIGKNRIPVNIVILNNQSSGMIKDREVAKYGDDLVHTTVNDGYSYPNFEKVAESYGIKYTRTYDYVEDREKLTFDEPQIIEIIIDVETELNPILPLGEPCQNLYPELPQELYESLDIL